MKDIKNYLIALLAGLLALSLFMQPAQSATSQVAPVSLTQSDLIKIAQSVPYISVKEQGKIVEYDRCLDRYNSYYATTNVNTVTPANILSYCAQYKP